MPTLHAKHTETQIELYRPGLTSPLLTQCAATNHRPYLHPILAPDGIGELTENQPGHHLWQHGLYVGLNDVNGVGFWTEGLNNSQEHDGTFHPHPLAPPELKDSTARWAVTTDWRDPSGQPLLTETQTWSLTDRKDTLLLDLDWELRAQTDLRFGKYSYGGLFLRMPWRAESKSTLLSSEGATSPQAAEGERARWIAVAMPLPGRVLAEVGVVGMAILDHPSNPEHPAPWRVDNNYGIAPSRCILGEWRLPRAATTRSRYRVFAFTREISREIIEGQWKHFAATPSKKA